MKDVAKGNGETHFPRMKNKGHLFAFGEFISIKASRDSASTRLRLAISLTLVDACHHKDV